jgi:hypothetical protein
MSATINYRKELSMTDTPQNATTEFETAGAEPSAAGPLEFQGTHASGNHAADWLYRYAHMKSDGAVEAAARTIAPLILEEYDGERRGIAWDTVRQADKDLIRVIARRALRAADSYACAHEVGRRDTMTALASDGQRAPAAIARENEHEC